MTLAYHCGICNTTLTLHPHPTLDAYQATCPICNTTYTITRTFIHHQRWEVFLFSEPPVGPNPVWT